MQKKLHKIDKLIYSNKYTLAKKEIDKIEEEHTSDFSDTEKLELLQTKAALFSKTLETEEILEVRKKIDLLLDDEIKKIGIIHPIKENDLDEFPLGINISDIAKNTSNKIKKQVSFHILDSLIDRILLNKQEKDKLEKINIGVMYFDEIQILKNIGEVGEAYFYESLYYNLRGDTQKEKEAIKKSAYEGNRDSINSYLENIENEFLVKYNSLKTPEEKIKYKTENLLKFEKEYNRFIKGNFVNIQKKEFSPRNPDLYQDLGEFFEKIDEPQKALEEYENGIESEYDDSYKLYGKIAELYFQNKLEGINLKIKYVTYAKKEGFEVDKNLPTDLEIKYFFISEFFRKLIFYANAQKDNKSQIYGLERMGDLVKNQKTYGIDQFLKKNENGTFSRPKKAEDYYKESIDLFLLENLDKQEDNLYLLKIAEKGGKSYSKTELQHIEYNLITKNINNLIELAKYYENSNNYEDATIKYIVLYEIHRTVNDLKLEKININEIFFRYLRDKLSLKIKKDNKKDLDFLQNIQNKIKNKQEIIPNEMYFLFSYSLDEDFDTDLYFNKLNTYIYGYNNAEYGMHIYLQVILNKLLKNNNFNKKILQKTLGKIYKREAIIDEDILEDLRLLFDEENVPTTQKIETKELPINEKFLKLIVENNENDETYIYEFISFLENDIKVKIREEISENNEKIYSGNIEKKEISKTEINPIMKKQLLKPVKNILKTASNNNEALLEQIQDINNLIEELKLNKKISEEQVIEIFNYSINDDNYYETFDMQKLFDFITIYDSRIKYGDLLLQSILLSLEHHFGFENKNIILPFFKQINKNIPLTKDNKEDLIDIFAPKFKEEKENRKLQNKLLGIETEDDTNTFEYTILLSEIIKKSRK